MKHSFNRTVYMRIVAILGYLAKYGCTAITVSDYIVAAFKRGLYNTGIAGWRIIVSIVHRDYCEDSTDRLVSVLAYIMEMANLLAADD